MGVRADSARIIIGGLLLIFIALQKLLTRRTEAGH